MYTVTQVVAIPNSDTLLVDAVDEDGNEVQGQGWQSAMSNYYPPEDYDEAGNLIEGSVSRAMTSDEQMAYWQSLLPAAPAPAPTVLYTAPTGGGADSADS